MVRHLPDSSRYKALTLGERLALPNLKMRLAPPGAQPDQVDRVLGWAGLSGSASNVDVATIYGAHIDHLAFVLRAHSLMADGPSEEAPQWLAAVEAILDGAPENGVPRLTPNERAMPGLRAFWRPIEPFVHHARQAFLDRAHRHLESDTPALGDTAPRWRDLLDPLIAPLWHDLTYMVSRAMVLELNIARLEQRLASDTAEGRFAEFLYHVSTRSGRMDFMERYPVLARLLYEHSCAWVDASVSLADRLRDDWEGLRALPGGPSHEDVLIRAVRSGDRHRGGQAVTILEFLSGAKVVYKPRPLSTDRLFARLADYVFTKAGLPQSRGYRLLDRGDFGWTEFVRHTPCESEDGVRRFFVRQGAYLCLLSALNASDLHHENIIAAGEYPVLIDTESLFHPMFGGRHEFDGNVAAADIMAASVLRVGFLPQRVWGTASMRGVDLSGLGGWAGQVMPTLVPTWSDAGTDLMRAEKTTVETQEGVNLPALANGPVDASDYAKEVEEGFVLAYKAMCEVKDELLGMGGVLAEWSKVQIRVIVRPTREYAAILDDRIHPDVLSDAADLDELLDTLWTTCGSGLARRSLVRAERLDLAKGDVPVFTACLSSTDLVDSRGVTFQRILSSTPFSEVEDRIRGMQPSDLERQLWCIRACLARTGTRQSDTGGRRIERALRAGQYAELAGTVADRLTTLATRQSTRAGWLGVVPERDNEWAVRPAALDLYSGVPGISLFLAYAGTTAGNRRLIELSQLGWAGVEEQLVDRNRALPLGLFAGWGGLLYAASHLAVCWADQAWLQDRDWLLEKISEGIHADESLDVVSGTAGAVGGLVAYYAVTRSDRALEVIERCGRHLVERSIPQECGVAWSTLRGAIRPMTGFSHGAAGIAAALALAHSATGNQAFLSTALSAVAYERTAYEPRLQNWADFRPSTQSGGDFTTSWCHGAPGIAVSRTILNKVAQTKTVSEDLDNAISGTLRVGFAGNHSLCHGTLGNLECVLYAAPDIAPSTTRSAVTSIADDLASTGNWQMGIQLDVETPGLMTGLAGIGMSLLRLSDRTRVPSVLALEPPRAR